MKVQKLKSEWNLGFPPIYKFVIISGGKTISQRLLKFFIWFKVHIQPFLRSKIMQISDPSNSRYMDCAFKPTKYWITILWICWTNLKFPAVVYSSWPIYILTKVYNTCLNRIRSTNWFYYIFVQPIRNFFAE